MLTVSDVQALIVITLGDAFVLNRRVRQHLTRTSSCELFVLSRTATLD
jgi:hypothetical protein